MAFDDTGHKRIAPPYAPYPSFKTFVTTLKEHVIPNRIDRSLLKNTSGTIQNQVMSAFKFFDLIDADGRPTDALRGLVEAIGTDDWPNALGGILRASYPDIFDVTLEKASSQEFNDKFRATYQAEGDTFRKATTFFLKAAREAGIPLSPYLSSGSKPIGLGVGNGKRRARAVKPKPPVATNDPTYNDLPPPSPPPQTQKALEYQLIDLMSETDIDDSVKQSIWSLVQYLMNRKAKKQTATATE